MQIHIFSLYFRNRRNRSTRLFYNCNTNLAQKVNKSIPVPVPAHKECYMNYYYKFNYLPSIKVLSDCSKNACDEKCAFIFFTKIKEKKRTLIIKKLIYQFGRLFVRLLSCSYYQKCLMLYLENKRTCSLV